MRIVHDRRLFAALIALAALAAFAVTGCEKDLMEADELPPTGSQITSPSNGTSLSSRVISVLGWAEVGATVDIYVDGVLEGTGTANVYQDDEDNTQYGRFTVPNIDLGEEGEKTIRAEITDTVGNEADPLEITVTLDTTAPPAELEHITDSTYKDSLGWWETGVTRLQAVGRTDVTSSTRRVRFGINEFAATEADTYEVAGGPDSVRFWVPMNAPVLTEESPQDTVTYYLEAIDDAGNIGSERFEILWVVEGKDTTLVWDDGDYGQFSNYITGRQDWEAAVLFQAPTWANYVTEIHYYIMNDDQDNPDDPEAPTTEAFSARVYYPTSPDSPQPGEVANGIGANTGDLYPEDAWLEFPLPESVDITSFTSFPNKQFFVGMRWESRFNPRLGYDIDEPIDYKSYIKDLGGDWVLDARDLMIRAVVSDIPSGRGRTAVILPQSHSR
ncbi:MAG: hypothetical protein GF405_06580 [Candidatus Eisenbacteria bacterium]|nr:hypothetical protein [Candidatus Eisenbacteria bacterium]